MKKTISVSIPEEKLTALRMYMEQKNFSLEEELSKYAEQLYTSTCRRMCVSISL